MDQEAGKAAARKVGLAVLASLREALGSETPLCQAPDGGIAKTSPRPRLKSCG